MKVDCKRLIYQTCGTGIPPWGVFYIRRTEIISGSDGILPDTEESADRIIEKALKEISKVKSEQEFMDEVYQERKLTLCERCRLLFRDKILDMNESPRSKLRGIKTFCSVLLLAASRGKLYPKLD